MFIPELYSSDVPDSEETFFFDEQSDDMYGDDEDFEMDEESMNQLVTMIIKMVLDDLEDVYIDEFETEEGTFSNVNIRIDSPPVEDINFETHEADESMNFSIKNLGVYVDTDMDMFYGALTGHTTLQLDQVDLDVETIPVCDDFEERLKIKYKMHIKDTDLKGEVLAAEDLEEFPEEVGADFMPLFGNVEANFKIAATDMVNLAFKEKVDHIDRSVFDDFSGNRRSPKSFKQMFDTKKLLSQNSFPFTSRNENKVSVKVTDSKAQTVESYKKMADDIRETMKEIENAQKDLSNLKRDLDRHHVFISKHGVNHILQEVGLSSTSYKLSEQENLQKKVRDYFGSDVVLECYNHEGETPEYTSKEDTIEGKQKVVCSLHPKGQSFDPLYQIDLQLNFNIHPKVDEDGKSLKAEFGTIQATSINTHNKKLEIVSEISDKAEDDIALQMDPFGFEMLIPFLMNSQYNVGKPGEFDKQTLSKFTEILRTPGLIDTSKIEEDLFP